MPQPQTEGLECRRRIPVSPLEITPLFRGIVPRGGVADMAKAKELIEEAEANCLISNSMKARVHLNASIA